MNFYAQNNLKRPVRLSDATRQFAYDSLNHKYGLDTKKTHAAVMDDVEGFETMSFLERYDASIAKIVTDAPIRICEGERISGAATLGLAINHFIPATYKGEAVCSSISHLTIDFETVLRKGINYIRQNAEHSLEKYRGTDREAFAKSCIYCLDCFDVWHDRYLKTLETINAETDNKYEANLKNLQKVPHQPASNFYEAVQSLWFVFAFVRLCGNWPGIGRLDFLLGEYLEKDLSNGTITMDEAREILAHFFIKGCEWISGGDYGSGDAQHYQNIVLAGVDENGEELTNNITYLTLEILEEFGISDFPTTVRVNSKTDEKLLRRVAEVMRFGGGILAVYNEDLVLDSLLADGYDLKEARKFANDGCWEVQIPGKTNFIYSPFDSLAILQQKTLNNYDGTVSFNNFEELYAQYVENLREIVEGIYQDRTKMFVNTGVPTKDWRWHPQMPCTVISLFEEGCVEKGLSYLEGGSIYNIFSPHIGGLADTVNSLYAIKKLVFDENKLRFDDFMSILKNNWEGEEALRQYVLNHYTYYGNDNDEVDMIAVQLLDDFADMCDALDGRCGYRFPGGVSTFGRQLEWAPYRVASAHGHKKGDVLAANCSATPGSDKEGATALIRSYCKPDLKRLATGSALDIKLLPSNVDGEEGLAALVALIKGFVVLGGYFMQPDVVDAEILKEAQAHPEDYQTLSVRVSGWNARFVTLSREWQNMIIEQTEH